MNKQVLVAIGREAGSGGFTPATELSKRLNIPMYDKRILDGVASELFADPEDLRYFDERPRILGLSRTVKGFNNSPQEQVAQLQFDFLTKRAAEGESFIVLGRCGDEILRNYPNLITIFLSAGIGFKKHRIMNHEGLSEAEALDLMARVDRRRKYFHNQYSRGKWGDSRHYDLCMNSERLGVEKTIDFLEQYIRARMENF